MFRNSSLLLALIIFVTLVVQTPGHALTIDSFTGEGGVEAPPVTAAQAFNSDGAIGGNRSLRVDGSGGSGPASKVYLYTQGGRLEHSQNASVIANSIVTWDGDNDATNLRPNGLGGIDLTQDGGQAVVIEGANPDHRTFFIVTIYDSKDSSGKSYIQVRSEQSPNTTPHNVTIPFSSFVAFGQASQDTLKRAGAITLAIDGAELGLDVGISWIGTNGKCNAVPSATAKIIDDCGVCGGTNQNKDSCGVCFGNDQSKDQCGVCFGNNKDLDRCGECFGNNRLLDSCSVCGGENKTKDQCGVCSGNGTSCLDCKGVAFGKAVFDSCGVCEGDNSTCRVCSSNDTSKSTKSMTKCVDAQGRYNLQIAAGKSHLRASATSSKAVVAKAKKLVVALPKTNLVCSGAQCKDKAINRTTISTLEKHAKKLYDIALAMLSGNSSSGEAPGVCHGSYRECLQRLLARRKEAAKARATAHRLYRNSLKCVRAVPSKESVCK